MKLDHCDNTLLTAAEAVELCLQGGSLQGVYVTDPQVAAQFNRQRMRLENAEPMLNCSSPDTDRTQFHHCLSAQWLMPEEYKQLDIAEYLREFAHTPAQIRRLEQELEIYAQNNLTDLLRFLVYLRDTMIENDIVWGVGRGSSVASYVLYLIGINSIDPMKYGLEIGEFLR